MLSYLVIILYSLNLFTRNWIEVRRVEDIKMSKCFLTKKCASFPFPSSGWTDRKQHVWLHSPRGSTGSCQCVAKCKGRIGKQWKLYAIIIREIHRWYSFLWKPARLEEQTSWCVNQRSLENRKPILIWQPVKMKG